MEILLIQTKNAEERKLVEEFLKKNNLQSRLLSEEDKEDVVLGSMMEETDYSDTVDTDTFLNKLRGQ